MKTKFKELIKNKKIWGIGIGVVIAVLVVVALVLSSRGSSEGGSGGIANIFSPDSNVKIAKAAESQIKLEEFSNGVFSMEKPEGWKVDAAGTGMFYAIRVYDPSDTNNQIFMQLKIQPLLGSEAAKSAWKNYATYYPDQTLFRPFTEAVVLNPATVENFYTKFGEIAAFSKMPGIETTAANYPTFNNFAVVEESAANTAMSSVATDSKVLRATFVGENGKAGEGLFEASLVPFSFGNYFGTDMTFYMAYDILAITADKDNFVNLEEILLKSANSIEFSDSYVSQTVDEMNAQTQQALDINRQMQQTFDACNQAWENRQKSYDITSQKQSDATMGYERVYDTETGEIYKAYNGFTDDYSGSRYQTVTDEMYTQGIDGYIEK